MKKRSVSIKDAYASAGVDLKAGDVFSAYAGACCRASYNNSQFVRVTDWSQGHFRGPRGWEFLNLPDGYIQVGGPDGIGTATIIISAAGTFYSAASRLVAMTADDITRFGGLPLVFFNCMEVKTLGEPGTRLFRNYKLMMGGLESIACDQKFVLMSGETAEMSDCVSSEIHGPGTENIPVFNWSGTMIGVNHPDKLISGKDMRPGDSIIALRDKLRSNGASLMRKYLRTWFSGKEGWWNNSEASGLVEEIACPAVIYSNFLATINGWYSPEFKSEIPVKGIAHLSGGGIRSKFADDLLFKYGLSATLDNLWESPSFMKECVSAFNMPDQEAYEVFNGGQGALMVVPANYSLRTIARAGFFGIEAKVVGYIEEPKRETLLKIVSKFSGKTFYMRPRQ